MRLLKWVASLALIAGLSSYAVSWNHYRAQLPPGLGLWWRVYAQNRTWGFGPGGNETGFNAFVLPAGAAERVRSGGTALLARLAPESEWRETPVPSEPPWVAEAGDRSVELEPGSVSVLAYLGRYGFFIDLPQTRRTRFDAAIRAPGSFYAFGRGGRVIVISPPQKRAWVAYAG